MEVLAAMGLGARELFKYNRENFKFDQDQRIEREAFRLEMQVKRFELFRDDVRDLVTLTVDRMDVYHLVGALFLEFCIVLFCEGRVQASAPPFLLSLFLLSNACAFIYLLLAVWLSMHASVASHSFGVRLLTRFIRLPIPTIKQISNLKSQLTDYERQGIGNLLRLPFLNRDQQSWKQVAGEGPNATTNPSLDMPIHADALLSAAGSRSLHAASSVGDASPTGGASFRSSPQRYLEIPAPDGTSAGSAAYGGSRSPHDHAHARPLSSPVVMAPGGSSASTRMPVTSTDSGPDFEPADMPALPTDDLGDPLLLPDEPEVIGGDALLSHTRGASPERHVQLFRQLQSKWQCYDAYCRVAMGLGVNQILQALCYFSVCHTTVENRSPTVGYALVVLFQAAALALAVLDLAGLNSREIVVIQLIGSAPVFLTAYGLANSARDESGLLDPDHKYRVSPFTFLCQAIWLELWLQVSRPSDDDSRLPRRFRQVLFLDVFGDANGWDPSDSGPSPSLQEESPEPSDTEFKTVGNKAALQLTLAQCALRRWSAVPDWGPSRAQHRELKRLKTRLQSSGSQIQAELDHHTNTFAMELEEQAVCEDPLRAWRDLSASERAADPFAKCLLGPFEHDAGDQTMEYYYDVDAENCVFEETPHTSAFVLTLSAVSDIIKDLETQERTMLEMRILRDLRRKEREMQRQVESSGRKRRAIANSFRAAVSSQARSAKVREVKEAASNSFPNLVSIMRNRRLTPLLESNSDVDMRGADRSRRSPQTLSQASDLSPRRVPEPDTSIEMLTMQGAEETEAQHPLPGSAGTYHERARSMSNDPTLIAMAGEHAQHFAPERLPWQVLSRVTRVLQCVWLWCCWWAFLKVSDLYEIDFQQHQKERRLCIGGGAIRFDDIPARWPHGALFHPQSLFCSAEKVREMSIASPFAMYTSRLDELGVIQLREVARATVPPSATLLCESSSRAPRLAPQSPLSDCHVAAPTQAGLRIWRAGYDHDAESSFLLRWIGRPWTHMTGSVVQCGHIGGFEEEVGNATECLLLAGWDGRTLPIVLLPIPEGIAKIALSTVRVRPSLDVPLAPEEIAKGIVSLSFAPRSGRLWVLIGNGTIDVWNLFTSQSLGAWKLKWPPRAAGFKPVAICEDPTEGLFAIGRSKDAGPLLLKAETPGHFNYWLEISG